MNISTNLNWRCLLAAALCILMLAVHSSDLADTAKSAPSGSERLVFKSSFEQEPLTAMAPQHELVRGVARTGQCSLMGQVSKPNDACVLKIPFEAKKNGVLLIRYWVRCDNKSTAATFVRIGKKRFRIGPRVDKIASDHWTRVKAQYRAATDVSGTIEVIAPSSHSAPMGKAWIDDIEIREVWDEFSWPDHVEDFPAIANDSMGQLWLASLGRQVPKRFIRVYGIDGKRRTLMCTIEPTGTTGIAAPAIAGLEKG